MHWLSLTFPKRKIEKLYEKYHDKEYENLLKLSFVLTALGFGIHSLNIYLWIKTLNYSIILLCFALIALVCYYNNNKIAKRPFLK